MPTIYPVIMCGGSGMRMWPLSRKQKPKQYHAFVGERSMLAETVARSDFAPQDLPIAPPTVICAAGLERAAFDEAEKGGRSPRAVLVEPFGRNTAAAAALAALEVMAVDPDGVVLLLPADHHMTEPAAFWKSVSQGLAAAGAGDIVTFGIEATGPETGYGYIERGEAIGEGIFKIRSFKEKPDLETAKAYIEAGGYFWNAGIFLYRGDTMIREFEALGPDILEHARAALERGATDGVFRHLQVEAFEPCRAQPVDVEIMERTAYSAVVAPVRAGWDDIGSWAALARLSAALDPDGGAPAIGDVFTLDCKGGLVRSDGPFVAALGLTDIIIVATGDSVLVAHKDSAQEVKAVVEALKKRDRRDLL